MSLGFLSDHPDSDFYLIPVGMNYFKRDSFRQWSFVLVFTCRARAFIDVGEPIEVKKELVERYKLGGKDKHEVSESVCREG